MRALFVLVFSLCLLTPLCAAGQQPSNLAVSGDLATDVGGSGPPGVAEVEGPALSAVYSPKWTVRAGFISLGRCDASAPSSLVIYNQHLQRVFDSATADRGAAAGPDITLGRALGDTWSVEARYFQADGWNNNTVVSDPGGLLLLGYGGHGDANTFSMNDTSRLYNIEVNLRSRRFERCPLLIGFRTMQLHESFEATAFNPQALRCPSTQTNNFLWGLQIGAEPILWQPGERFRLEGIIKSGMYGGQSYQTTFFLTSGSSLSDSRSSVPFVAELGLNGVWTFNKHWSLEAGLELMWMTNMALAMDQPLTVLVGPPPTGSMYNKSTALYGGVTVTLERRF